MQTATARMLAVETGPQRRTERDHTCDAREEMRKGAEPVWIGDDLGRLEQRESGPTRMATWNVGGRAGTLNDEEKLLAVLDMMEKMRIHLLCVCEGNATQEEVSKLLHTCRAATSFKAYGYTGNSVLWLVRSGMGMTVLGCLKTGQSRVSALLLAGRGKVRTLVIGIYGIAGATTSAELSGRQTDLLHWVSRIANRHQGEQHQLVVLGDLNMVPTETLHSSASLEKSTMQGFRQFQDDHELENALLTRLPGATINEGVFTYADPLKLGEPRSLLDHVLVSRGLTRAAGILIWPAHPRLTSWADHDACVADVDLNMPTALNATRRRGPKAAHMFPPSQWHNLGQNPHIQLEIAAIKEGLGVECDQQALDGLFERFLKVGTPKASTKERKIGASRQGPLYHILRNIMGQLRAGNAYVRRCLQRADPQGKGSVTVERTKLDTILCQHEEAEGTGIYDNLALAGLQAWEEAWAPDRWTEWLQQLKVAKKFVQRTSKAAQKLWSAEGTELRRGQAIAEARSGKLAAILDLIFIPDKAGTVDDCVWREVRTAAAGGIKVHWEQITEATELEEAALEIVRDIFPKSRDWQPSEAHAHSVFPEGFAFKGCVLHLCWR